MTEAEALRAAWAGSEWKRVEGTDHPCWRREPEGRRSYPCGLITEAASGSFFIYGELWSARGRRPRGEGGRRVRGDRTFGTPKAYGTFEAAAEAFESYVERSLREISEDAAQREAAQRPEALFRQFPPAGGAPSGPAEVHDRVARFLARLSGAWEVPVRFTLIARVPGREEAGLCVTDDTIEEAAAELDRLRLRPAVKLDEREAERARLREIFTGRPS